MKETITKEFHLEMGKHAGNFERKKASSQAKYQSKNIRNYVKIKTKLQSINYVEAFLLINLNSIQLLYKYLGYLQRVCLKPTIQ